MLIRVVRMTFQPEKVPEFLEIFRQSQPFIRGFAGCQHLELLQDADNPHIFSTLSHWQSLGSLENYRQSELFKRTWAKTKALFADKPQAFSLLPLPEYGEK
jgi:heme oxygenase (mycobilin-producing)